MNVLAPGTLNPLQGRNVTFDQASVGVAYPGQLDGAAVAACHRSPGRWHRVPHSRRASRFCPALMVYRVIWAAFQLPPALFFHAQRDRFSGADGERLSRWSLRRSPRRRLRLRTAWWERPTRRLTRRREVLRRIPSRLAQGSSFPPGLSLSGGGVLSGTPTAPGLFTVSVTITDGARQYADDAACFDYRQCGAGAGNVVTPSYLQINYALGSATPTPVAINVTATTGAIPFNAMVSGIPGASLSAGTGNATDESASQSEHRGPGGGTYGGVVALYSAQAVNQYTHAPVSTDGRAVSALTC